MVIKSMQLVSIISHRPCPGRRMRCSCVCHRLMYLHINNHPLVLAVYQLPTPSFLLPALVQHDIPPHPLSVIRMGIASNRPLIVGCSVSLSKTPATPANPQKEKEKENKNKRGPTKQVKKPGLDRNLGPRTLCHVAGQSTRRCRGARAFALARIATGCVRAQPSSWRA
jgi:hypothetical protein